MESKQTPRDELVERLHVQMYFVQMFVTPQTMPTSAFIKNASILEPQICTQQISRTTSAHCFIKHVKVNF